MNTTSNRLTIAALYKFVSLPDFRELRQPLLQRCLDLRLKGTFLLAPEGINGTVAGNREAIDGILAYLRSEPRFADLAHKESKAARLPFHRMKVKLKQEIVSLGIAGTDPENITGRHVEPEHWNAEIARPDTLVLDIRNQYETEIGSFRNAVTPDTGTFREFPGYVDKNLNPHKHTRVAMFCTGVSVAKKPLHTCCPRGV